MENEDLKKALTEVLNTILDAKDFVLSEAPEVIQQLLRVELAISIFLILACCVVFYLSYKSFFYWSCQDKDYEGDWETSKIAACALGGTASLAAFCVMITSFIDVLKITLAPKVYLVEYVSKMVS